MKEELSKLQDKVREYQTLKTKNFKVNWELLKGILCLLADIIILIEIEIPDRFKFLKNILLFIANKLKYVCESLTDEDFKEI